jgi:hypothetical protein
MKRTITKTIAAALVTGLSFVSAAAHAQQQTYPASMCVSASADPVTATYLGQVRNNSTTATIRVVCPVVRDLGSYVAGNAAGNVWVSDGHFNQDVCCAARARTPSNGSTFTTANRCTTGVQNFINLPFAGPVVASQLSYRYYACTLPPLYMNTPSIIEGYRSGEL